MKLDDILSKKKKSMKDKKVAFIFESIDRLHDEDISEEDFEYIHIAIRRIWRKYHPLSELTTPFHGGKS